MHICTYIHTCIHTYIINLYAYVCMYLFINYIWSYGMIVQKREHIASAETRAYSYTYYNTKLLTLLSVYFVCN